MVYASTSLALAAVEIFILLEPNLGPDDVVSIQGDIPDAVWIGRLEPKMLPKHWRESESYPDFSKIKFRLPESFEFDARMFR